MTRMITLLTVLMASISFADSSEREIQQLVQFVAHTECQYERNGERHTGTQAVEHIQKKYDYYRDDIKTAEDFIRLAAKQSALSGKEYRVHCPEVPSMTSEVWLLQELERIRQDQ